MLRVRRRARGLGGDCQGAGDGHDLKGAAAPKWMTDGVPRLEMEQHLKDRASLKKSAAERAKEAAKAGEKK